MLVVVVSPDFELGRVLTTLLAGDGCAITACAGAVQALELPESTTALALVIDGRADAEALSLVSELRRRGTLREGAPVVFVCAVVDDWAEIARIRGRLVVRPASLLDVAELLRCAIPTRRADDPLRSRPPPTARRGEALANARRLMRWWATRATGVLCVEGRADGWFLLSQGGPVGPDGLAAIDHALAGADVTLDRCEVDEPGDRGALGRRLWSAARDAVAGESVISLIPAQNGLTRAAFGLPLSPETRRCIERLGGVSVERLARRERASVAEVAADFAALRWLGVIGLRDPMTPPVDVDVDTPSEHPVPTEVEVAMDAPSPSPQGRQATGIILDRLVRDGIDAVSRADWRRADELLSRARRTAPENPIVAAHLGWARFHNPDIAAARRASEGTDLVELALQIDADCALAWRYCGELATLRGDVALAARCFGTALKLLS